MIPSPLHPAIVHFPIVLILIGTLVAVAAAFTRRWQLPWIAAGLLLAGAAGAVAATWTGDEEQEMAGELSSQAEKILEEHEEWGEATRNSAIAAALLACTALAVGRFPLLSRGLAVTTVLAAVASSYCVVQTGHYGGQLVYKHGTGINTLAGSGNNSSGKAKKTAKPDQDDD